MPRLGNGLPVVLGLLAPEELAKGLQVSVSAPGRRLGVCAGAFGKAVRKQCLQLACGMPTPSAEVCYLLSGLSFLMASANLKEDSLVTCHVLCLLGLLSRFLAQRTRLRKARRTSESSLCRLSIFSILLDIVSIAAICGIFQAWRAFAHCQTRIDKRSNWLYCSKSLHVRFWTTLLSHRWFIVIVPVALLLVHTV